MELSASDKNSSTKTEEFSAKLVAYEFSVSALSYDDKTQMWHLFEQYYDEVSKAQFLKDLNEKSHVILLLDPDNRIQGFSTIKCFYSTINNRKNRIIFSGDTVINHQFWGQTALQRQFYRFLFKEFLKHPLTPVYWYLISKGYKTYLLLSRNFKAYWPNHLAPTPPSVKAMIADISLQLFPEAWRDKTGTLEFGKSAGQLKQTIAPITDDLLHHADVEFFTRANPGHAQGNELCCLGYVNLALVLSYPLKLIKKKLIRCK